MKKARIGAQSAREGGTMWDKETKPGHLSGGGHITLKVKNQDGNQVFFRIKRDAQLKDLMNGYCVRQSIDFETVVFLFDGHRLRGEQTPDEQGLEEGDEIHAMLHRQSAREGGTMSHEETKPGYMNLKVRGTDGNEVFFRVRRSTQLKKLMYCYCELQSKDYLSFAFMFDGRRLRGVQTPHELAMEEGDEIFALPSQRGC